MSFYTVLGVADTATLPEIIQAYRRLAMRWHPDRHAGASADDLKKAGEKFKTISSAYETLSSPGRRVLYDAGFRQGSAAPQTRPKPGPTKPWESEMSRMTREEAAAREAARAARAKARQQQAEEMLRRQRELLPAGKNMRRSVRVAFETALAGGKTTVKRAYFDTCPTCKGRGCRKCGDKGRVKVTRPTTIPVPPNTANGATYAYAELGHPSPMGGLNGELHVKFEVVMTGDWRLEGRDLHGIIEVPFSVALLGGEAGVTTPTGKTLMLAIPARTNSGKVLRLPGEGLPKTASSPKGNLFLRVQIMLPKENWPLSDNAKDFLRAMDRPR